jgi:RNA polymerase sigma-70 factor (ECF subfamily)
MSVIDEIHPGADAPFKRQLVQTISTLRPYSRRLARNQQTAEDLVQDTVLRALEKHYQWERGTNLEAWLRTIMRNRFFEYGRKMQPISIGDFCDESSIIVSTEARQPICMELMETGHAIDQLSHDFRQVLELVAIDGISYEDAARVLKLPVGTVRSRLSRARSSLRLSLNTTRRYPRHHLPGQPAPV